MGDMDSRRRELDTTQQRREVPATTERTKQSDHIFNTELLRNNSRKMLEAMKALKTVSGRVARNAVSGIKGEPRDTARVD